MSSAKAPLQKCMRQSQNRQPASRGDKSESETTKRRHARRTRDAGTNNSMPFDKLYRAPEPPVDVNAYATGLAGTAKQFREAFRPERNEHLTVYFRVRRRNYEELLWHFFSQGTFTKADIYSPRNLRYWTLCLRLRIRVSYPLGKVMETLKYRLGITNPDFKFCLDGFFGMVSYADAFGTLGACPWMELSNFSTVKSLGLQEGANIYLCMATPAQTINVLKMRQSMAANAKAASE